MPAAGELKLHGAIHAEDGGFQLSWGGKLENLLLRSRFRGEKPHSKHLEQKNVYWTILWRTLLRIVWCIKIKISTVESKVIYGLQFKK